jgi:hypothetical protein
MTEQLSINLASDISYVSGTVNGEVANFSLTSPGIWSAVVPKSQDCKYVIKIIAYNNLGTQTVYNTIIYKLNDMIPVRTNWTSKDFYNAEDLNRVEANTQFVAEYLNSLYYNITLETIKTDRDMTSIDFLSSINRVEQNIEALKDGFITPPEWQSKRIWSLGMGFDYKDANRLEINLKLLYEWALIAKDNLVYCGTFSCGTDWEGGLF